MDTVDTVNIYVYTTLFALICYNTGMLDAGKVTLDIRKKETWNARHAKCKSGGSGTWNKKPATGNLKPATWNRSTGKQTTAEDIH